MRKLILVISLLLTLAANGQENDKQANDSLLMWLGYLNEKGLEIKDDTLLMGMEFKRVLQDETYRKLVFPETYSWEQTISFIQNQDLKKAFWYMINLYPENDINKELVLKSVITYDKLFKMDELLVNTFYTYCLVDPMVSGIVDGKPEVVRPDLLESKMNDVKEIVDYIYRYRNK